jgi:CBS domain-containing protein
MIVADIMMRRVLATAADRPITEAIRLMIAHRVSGLPVIGPKGEIVGILTEGDLLRREETGTAGDRPGWFASFFLSGREAEKYVRTHGRRVGDVMTTRVVTVTEDTPLPDVVTLMQRHHIKRLPVVRDGRLIGIVSRADLIRRVCEALPASAGSADDEALRRAISDAMAREPWAASTMANVTVKDGVVQLDGCLFDSREREALGVLAENVPGVKRVENKVICIEPYTGTVIYDPAL